MVDDQKEESRRNINNHVRNEDEQGHDSSILKEMSEKVTQTIWRERQTQTAWWGKQTYAHVVRHNQVQQQRK